MNGADEGSTPAAPRRVESRQSGRAEGRWLRFLAGWGCGLAELPAVRMSNAPVALRLVRSRPAA